ncbi:MAG: terminase large subunit [Armatimonadota bacterium]
MAKHPVDKYIADVLDGRINTCRWTRLAVKRHVDDLKTGKSRGLIFDKEEAEYRLGFYQFCHHSKGEWAGQVVQPEPWQQFIQWCLFGWKRRRDGYRRFRRGYVEVARKNGKSTDWACLGNYLLVADNEPGAEIYTIATKMRQSRLIHEESVRMVKSSPYLRERIGIYKDNLHIELTNSKYEPLPEKIDHGLNIHGGLIDELHEHPSRDAWDVTTTSTGSRRQPLVAAITTAGFDRYSICWEQREYLTKILKGQVENDAFFGIIYCLDMRFDWPDLLERPGDGEELDPDVEYEDDFRDPAVWIKANPNLGVSKKYEDVEMNVREAVDKPSALNAILRLDFNVWTQASVRWLSPVAWAKCGAAVDPEALKGRRCYGGLDLSSSIDLSAFALVFPPEKPGEKYQVLVWCWIPKENMLERVRRDKVPYDQWYKGKLLEATPGGAIDFRYIEKKIADLSKVYDIKEIAYDRWGAADIVQRLQEIGGDDWVVMFGQGYGSMNAPCKALEREIANGNLAHGNHPILNWAADNVVVTEDPAGNIKPDKAKSTEKIDPMVATIMAFARATLNTNPASVYEKRDMFVL